MIEYWKARLSAGQKAQYDTVVKAMKRCAPEAAMPMSPNFSKDFQHIYEYIAIDHPELYYISPKVGAAVGLLSIKVQLSYLYDPKERQTIDRSFAEFYSNLKKGVYTCKTETEKARYAIFLLMKDSKYEINNLTNQNAASAIHFKSAQCSGFSAAFKCAMDFLGIWCIIVNGSNGGPHAWNILKLDGEYYHADITSFSGVELTDMNSFDGYPMFESDSQKKQKGYVWDDSKTPPCTKDGVIKPRVAPPNNSNQNSAQRTSAAQTGAYAASTSAAHSNLPTITRLFDIQTKISECLKKKEGECEFVLKIPAYTSEKLMRTLQNTIKEQANANRLSIQAELSCTGEKFHIKFHYGN